ncbi:hypothetical protein BTA51_11415 [Hahella sp. CCB-MM4]|uniref:hypothetical protein n=1 Tax=Hahella sp. (strain CCB-MM4) TaxID=1926491 RepID=UPI000B9B592E|nr:hypothetical protein [Hahella sp. CCB-MM4]OZG73098.1 hypothetical protein BTA51_11415 [Hahella sp. CCB-MM4]
MADINLKMLIIPLFSLAASCATSESTHAIEAADFCEVHNPERRMKYWQDGDAESTELYYQKLASDIKAIIKTEGFRNIFKEQLNIPPSEYKKEYSNDYVYYKKKISELLDEEWDCEYLKHHYVLEFVEE